MSFRSKRESNLSSLNDFVRLIEMLRSAGSSRAFTVLNCNAVEHKRDLSVSSHIRIPELSLLAGKKPKWPLKSFPEIIYSLTLKYSGRKIGNLFPQSYARVPSSYRFLYGELDKEKSFSVRLLRARKLATYGKMESRIEK